MIRVGLITGIAIFAFNFTLSYLIGLLFPNINQEYQNTNFFRPYEDPLMLLFFLHPIILGFVLAYFWRLVKEHLKGDRTKKALEFAKIYFLVSIAAGMFATLTTFQVSLGMVLVWTISGFLEAFLAGLIFTKLKW